MIPLQLRVIALLVLVLLLLWVVSLIRRQRLSVQDSLAWLLTTLSAMAITAFPELLGAVSHLLGIQVPANALFGAGLVYLGVNVLALTIVASESSARLRRLVQEVALLRAELERERSLRREQEAGR